MKLFALINSNQINTATFFNIFSKKNSEFVTTANIDSAKTKNTEHKRYGVSMSGLQMILSIGAFFILSLIIINMNKNILLTEEVMLDSNLGIQAISLGSSIIEEAERKSFDSETDTAGVSNTSSLTMASSFGPDAGEVANDHRTYNDFDDFHGYTIIDSSMAMTKFKVTCIVEYADPAEPDKKTTSRSWHKKLIVNVSSESMLDTVQLTTIFSYWAFL